MATVAAADSPPELPSDPPPGAEDEVVSEAGDSRARVAVVRFDVPVADEWWLAEGEPQARDLFAGRLEETGLLEAFDRVELDRLALEERLRDQGSLSPASAIKAGRILDVDFVLGGELLEYAPTLPGFVKRSVGRIPGLDSGQSYFVTEFGATLWSAREGRVVWSDRLRLEWPIERSVALEIEAGEGDPAARYLQWLEPVLRQLADRMLEEPDFEALVARARLASARAKEGR